MPFAAHKAHGGVKSQSTAMTRIQTLFRSTMKLSDLVGKDNISLTLIINGEKGHWWPREYWLSVGWGSEEAPWYLPKGVFRRQGRDRQVLPVVMAHLVSLDLVNRSLMGSDFPAVSACLHHLSCQILSSESIISTLPSVLRLPWLQLHSHQQWGLRSRLQSTEPGSANDSPWAKSILPPVFAKKFSLTHSHLHSLVYCCFCAVTEELSSATETQWSVNLEVFTIWSFTSSPEPYQLLGRLRPSPGYGRINWFIQDIFMPLAWMRFH